jgi:HK97 family phage prohead protease
MPDQLATFETPASTVFRASAETRTITGLVVPFGVTGENWEGQFQFDAGTEFTWPTDVTRVKLLVSHDYTAAIGHATALEKTKDGIVGTFKVARGAEGDKALSLAEDHVLDGLSMGLARGAVFNVDGEGVRRGVSAALSEVSLTPLPAFADARTTSVAASAVPNRKEPVMGDENPQVEPAPAAFDAAALLAQFEQAVDGRLTAFADRLAVPAREPNPTAVVQVREELPYRFDGVQGGKFSLLEDAKAIQFSGDADARKRMDLFLGEAFAAIAGADVSSLNPTQQRPELYVGPLRFNRPLWGLVSTGAISDATPFMLPKFATKAGKGIQNHAAGVEPTEMSLTTTSQTITPVPLSGLAKINREVYDQGGNPSLDKIIWDEVMNDYFEKLEVDIATLLATGTGTEINVGAGANDAAKVALLKAALVGLQFVKGGDRFTSFAGDPTLYGGCAGALDTTGRPLLPVINPTNADGTIRAGYEAIQIGNRSLIPAWALDKTVANAEVSYLFVPESVYAWVSAPQRIDLQLSVREVQIGVWGYEATGCVRAADIVPVDWTTADA